MPVVEQPERLEPLKTLHETRANDKFVEALVFEIPAKLASRAVSIVKPVIQDASPKPTGLHHLRKLIHLPHLPKDLLERRVVVTRPGQPSVFLIQVASQELADAMLAALDYHIKDDPNLKAYDHLPRCFPIPVPLYAPLNEQQAKLWSERHWPSVYNPAAQVLQDAPPLHQLRKVMAEHDSIFTDDCIALANIAAQEAGNSGCGKAVGAVVVDPLLKQVIAVAGDARWIGQDKNNRNGPNGRPEYHALMRVVSMVANKELRRRLATGGHKKFASTCAEGIPGQPISSIEKHYLETSDQLAGLPPSTPTSEDAKPTVSIDSLTRSFAEVALQAKYSSLPPMQTESRGEGYLCSGLDLYLTHEPCVCCGMAMVHSRFRTCTFINRIPKTGALCAKLDKNTLGYGLFWRRELNWRVMTFQHKKGGADAKTAVSTEVFQA